MGGGDERDQDGGGRAPSALLREVLIPADPADGAPVAVLLHGRGADRHDLLGLARGLPEGTLVVTPQAPHPGGAWGYGGGWAWYRYLGEDRVVTETLLESLEALDAFLEELPAFLPVRPGPLFLGGFSQGGTTSLAYALTRREKDLPVLNFSGFLVDDSAIPVGEAARELRVFWGHGLQDPAIPHALGRKGRAALQAAGARVTTSDHDIGHWIDPVELRRASEWMRGVMGEG